MTPIRIALAEDQADLRASLERRLGYFPEVAVVAAAASGDELLAHLAQRPEAQRPHVVLMDIEMPGRDGVSTTALVRERWPEVAVVMLTVFEDEQRLTDALVAGACGYLLKDESTEVIVGAAREAAEGGTPVSGPMAKILIRRVREAESSRRDDRARAESAGLTTRERDVLRLLAQGHTDATAAELLHVSAHTVQSHTKSIYRKLGVHSRAEAVRQAVAFGLA